MTEPPSKRSLSSREVLLEALVGLGAISILAFQMRWALFLGTSTLGHDHVYWGYPVFHFYAESLLSGRLPLWNPFTHGGEPFYLLLLQIRLLDPVSPLVVLVGSFFTTDLILLYSWDRFARSLIMAAGVYLLLRPWARHRLTRLSLIVILPFCSLHWSAVGQMGIADQFIFAPYVGLFLFRILGGDGRWGNWLAMAIFFGLNLQSYFFSGPALFVALILTGLLIFRRDLLRNVIATPGLTLKVLAVAAVIVALALPNIVLLSVSDRFVFPARLVEGSYKGIPPRGHQPLHEPGGNAKQFRGLGLPYAFVYHTGSFSSVWDFIQILAPSAHGIYGARQYSKPWGEPSEGFMYIGMLPYALALLGLLGGRHPLKKVWLVVGAGFGLTMLGPEFGVHALLFWLFPPFWFVRHSMALALFFVTALLYFFVLGADHLISSARSGTPLFSDEARGRFLARLAPRESLQRPLGALALAILLLGGVWLVLELQFPFTFYRVLFVALLMGAIWVARSELGAGWLFRAVFLTHVAFVSYASAWSGVWTGLASVGVFLMIPLVTWLWWRRDGRKWAGEARPFGPLAVVAGVLVWVLLAAVSRRLPLEEAAVFGAVAGVVAVLLIVALARGKASWSVMSATLFLLITIDVLHYSERFAHLAQNMRPDKVLAYEASPRPPRFPESRRVFAGYPADTPYHQLVRYDSVLMRQASAFTPPLYANSRRLIGDSDIAQNVTTALTAQRINSFLMLKNYFTLVNINSRPVIEGTLAIGRSLIQFKYGFDAMSNKNLRVLFQNGKPAEIGGWLENYVMLSDDNGGVPYGVERVPFQLWSESLWDESQSLRADGWKIPKVPSAEGARDFEATVQSYDYNSLQLVVRTGAPGLLYWADGYDPYWRALLDGRPAQVYRANLNFKAVAVPAGRHEVRFVYSPTGFLAAVAVFYGLIAVFALWGLIHLVLFWVREESQVIPSMAPTWDLARRSTHDRIV